MATQPLDALIKATRFHCKPEEWPSHPTAKAGPVDEQGLPTFDFSEVYGRSKPRPVDRFRIDTPQHFVLLDGEDSFLIDTQGYDFARYVARIG